MRRPGATAFRETREIDPVFRHQSGDGRRWIDDTSSGNVVFDIHEVVLLRDGRERGAPFRRHNLSRRIVNCWYEIQG